VVEGVGSCLDILWPFFWSTNKFYTLEKSLAFEEHESSDLHLSEYAPFGLNDVSDESNKCSPLLAKDNIQVGGSDGVQISTITSVACAVGQVLNWFFLSIPGFFGIYLSFQRQRSL
jgi:hypothetical protein